MNKRKKEFVRLIERLAKMGVRYGKPSVMRNLANLLPVFMVICIFTIDSYPQACPPPGFRNWTLIPDRDSLSVAEDLSLLQDSTGIAEIVRDQSGLTIPAFHATDPMIKWPEHCSVYPNPSAGVFNVQLKPGEPGVVTFSITDVYGRQVYRSQSTRSSGTAIHRISLQGMRPGIYFLRVMTGKESFIERIVKVE